MTMNRVAIAFLAAIIGIILVFTVPFLPWVKPEISEKAKVITFKDGKCVVETESTRIINVDNCDSKDAGEQVMVKYRAETSAGELIP
ncbi:MAG: hypothetical protein HMLIMOIP_001010 [Candidatus Nitrosomirales archaeon]|jgi:hypothetical protein